MTREMGKVLDETRGDVQEAIDMTFFMAGEGRRQYGQTVPSELRDKFAMSMRQPVGVCGDHHAVEFSDGDPVVEDHSGAGLRQHRRVQAGDADAALRAQLREDSRRSRHSARRRQPGHRRWRRRRERPARQRRRPRRLVHRFHRRRAHRLRARRAVLQESASRDGRQERHHDHGRCESRAGGRGVPVGRLRDDRSALHGGEPRRRAREGVRRVSRAVRRARQDAPRRRRPRSEERRWGRLVSKGQL